MLLTIVCPSNTAYEYHHLTNPDVVVGGGTAGLVVATRLAENGTYTVAVVEAGGFYELENGNLTIVPGYYSQNLNHPSVDWNFETTPQASLENQTFSYARGKTLGGRYAKHMIHHTGYETYRPRQFCSQRHGLSSRHETVVCRMGGYSG